MRKTNNLDVNKKEVEEKNQMKHSVTYRETEKETELFKWVEEKAEIIGPSNAIKLMLYELMKDEKNNSKIEK